MYLGFKEKMHDFIQNLRVIEYLKCRVQNKR